MSDLDRLHLTCKACQHPIVALSKVSLQAALQDHADHVNETADRRTDPHFTGIQAARIASLPVRIVVTP